MYVWRNRLVLVIFFLSNAVLDVVAFSDTPAKKRLSFKKNNYFIKRGYKCRSAYVPDNHAHSGIDPAQEEVYQEAYTIARECNAQTIGDIGCGSAYKLLKYFNSYTTIGFEVDPNFAYLTSHYPEKTWIYGDFNSTVKQPFFDVIICADVVEHLVDPDDLLNWIQRLDFNYLVISTPDRDKLRLYQKPPEQSQSGPPLNPHHIREWSFAEFEAYIGKFFEIKRHFHNNTEWMAQVIIATKK